MLDRGLDIPNKYNNTVGKIHVITSNRKDNKKRNQENTP
jgi:hypothetical protein